MEHRKIVFITGGSRSGKSSFAIREASRLPGGKAYIATAQAGDEEMKARIEAHRRSRGDEWDTYETPFGTADLIRSIGDKYEVIVLDCLTLWLSNIVLAGLHVDAETEDLISSITERRSSVFIVSNEVGMGIVPENELARRFRDFAGVLNQRVAEISDEVYTLIAGIPLRIKEAV